MGLKIGWVVWLLIAAIVIGYPLVAGRIRFGGPGSEPVVRATDPSSFWMTYALSTALFLGVSLAVGYFIRSVVH